MPRLTLALALLVVLLVQADGAGGRESYNEWLTINEVTLDGQRRVLCRHNMFREGSSLSPNRDQLAYAYACGGCRAANRLMVADVRSPRERLLVETQDGIRDVAWSPDGRSIAIGTNGIWVFELDGSALRRVASSGVGYGIDLAWSPDSKWLAFARQQDPYHVTIVVLSLVTGEERVLGEGFRPQWSPNGESVLFDYATKIHVVSKHGGQPRTVARGSFPAWSPDGTRLAFVRYAGFEPSVWVTSSRGGQPRRLVRNADTVLWSPDSRLIAVSQGRRRCSSKLSVVRVNRGRPRRLATHTRIVAPLAWSSTSRKVLYTGERCRN